MFLGFNISAEPALLSNIWMFLILALGFALQHIKKLIVISIFGLGILYSTTAYSFMPAPSWHRPQVGYPNYYNNFCATPSPIYQPQVMPWMNPSQLFPQYQPYYSGGCYNCGSSPQIFNPGILR